MDATSNATGVVVGMLEDVHEGTTLQLLRCLIQGLFDVNTIYAFESASGKVSISHSLPSFFKITLSTCSPISPTHVDSFNI